MNYRWLTWLLSNSIMLTSCWLYASVTVEFNSAGTERTILSALIAVSGILSLFTFPAMSSGKKVCSILAISLIARILLLPTAESDDVNRYLWEGKLTSAGVSPYGEIADSKKYINHRDQYWEKMNHRNKPTAYPPLAMQAFRLINYFGYNPISYKIVFLILDICLVALLLAILHFYRKPLHWALFYALSPISLLSFSAEGHFDILMVLAIMLSIYAYIRKWMLLSGIAIGIAISVKIMALVIAPLILWRAGFKAILATLIVVLIPVFLQWNDVYSMLNGLFVFGSKGRFNGPIYQFLELYINLPSHLTSLIATGTFILTWTLGFIMTIKQRLWSGLFISFGSLVIFSPIVHFWYLSWILPFIAIRPKLSWVSLSVSMSLYFLVWNEQANGHGWILPIWARWAFWVPFIVFFIYENRSIITRWKYTCTNNTRPSDLSISIVIPVSNPGNQLQNCLDSLVLQTVTPQEVIIVDADSNDGSIENIQDNPLNLRVIKSERGRGTQITTGVQSAKSTWVIILHADHCLQAQALETLQKVITRNPKIVGGAIGQRFSDQSAALLLLEIMNEFRAVLVKTSFGDQTQFIHKQTALNNDILTHQPLMEDVEMSNRIDSLEETAYLGIEGTVSAQKWQKGDFIKRFLTIIEFCFRYQFLSPSRNQRLKLSEAFYKRYYKE